MDSDLIAYSPIAHRPALRWPNGARVALWVVPNIEHYEYLPKFVRTRDPWPRSPHPDVLGYSQRDYGNRVGLWRFFDLSDALGLRCTVSLNMTVIQHYPAILEAMEKRKWELMSHGIYNTRYHWDFSLDEERAAMLESRDIHRKLTGREQKGWFSPAITNTLNTFDLAAECGFDYTADLYHDDQPFPLKGRTAEEMAKMPEYYVMDLKKNMAETAAQFMPSAAEIAVNKWFTDEDVAVYASEYGRVGFQGGLDGYRRGLEPRKLRNGREKVTD